MNNSSPVRVPVSGSLTIWPGWGTGVAGVRPSLAMPALLICPVRVDKVLINTGVSGKAASRSASVSGPSDNRAP